MLTAYLVSVVATAVYAHLSFFVIMFTLRKKFPDTFNPLTNNLVVFPPVVYGLMLIPIMNILILFGFIILTFVAVYAIQQVTSVSDFVRKMESFM